MGGLNSALGSLDKASTMNTMSNIFQSMGLTQHSRVATGLARGHELTRADLQARISNRRRDANNSNNQIESGIDGPA
jgi:C4-dicarboxylate-specific signal transduction histidine kinase